eukprot:515975-Rhodomonas_salina.3
MDKAVIPWVSATIHAVSAADSSNSTTSPVNPSDEAISNGRVLVSAPVSSDVPLRNDAYSCCWTPGSRSGCSDGSISAIRWS